MNTFTLLPDGNLQHESSFVLITENEHIRLDMNTADVFIDWMKEDGECGLEERVGRLLVEALRFLRKLN